MGGEQVEEELYPWEFQHKSRSSDIPGQNPSAINPGIDDRGQKGQPHEHQESQVKVAAVVVSLLEHQTGQSAGEMATGS